MANLERLRAALGIEAMLVSDIGNVSWLTGFTGTYAVSIVTANRAVFITDSRYTIQAAQQVKGFDLVQFDSKIEAHVFIAAQVAELGIKELGFESNSVTFETYEKWSKAFEGVKLVPSGTVLPPLRMIKTAEEIDRVRRACALADHAFQHIQRMITPGVTELDLELDLEFFIRRQGAGVAFPSIVVSGANSARPHGHATDKPLEAGDLVTFDFGATIDGYHSDMTRTVGVVSLDEQRRNIYAAVLEAQLAAIDALKPGATAAAVDKVARDVLAKYGLAQYFGHGLGHGLGSAVHDHGRLSGLSKDVIEPGQIWTIEPGVYIEGVGGVRIEDDLLITESGNEILTHTPKDLLILPANG